MTTLCGGGASAAKAGVAATIIFTAGSLSSLLNNKGGYWATLAAPLLGVLAYSATELCTTDPPAQPTITDEEYAALLQLGPWDTLQSALVKLSQLLTRVIWFDLCECTSVATPVLPPDTLDPPADVSLPTYGAGGPCPQPRFQFTQPDVSGVGFKQWHNITALAFPGMQLYETVASAGPPAVDAGNDIIKLPCNWGAFTIRLHLVSGGATTGTAYGLFVNYVNASRTYVSSPISVGVSDTTPDNEVSGTFDCVASPYIMLHHGLSSAVTGPGVVDVEIDITCSGNALPVSNCCSDSTAIALMGQLLQQVNLIQRQQVPFAYVPGSVHSALSGTGEIAVQGLLGALVEIVWTGDFVGVEDGTPQQTFEAGWISWGNADGFTQRERLTNETLVSLPALAGQFTRIGYTLAVGVAATITELVREP